MKPNSYFTVVCLVCVGILACLLPQPSGAAAAAADSTLVAGALHRASFLRVLINICWNQVYVSCALQPECVSFKLIHLRLAAKTLWQWHPNPAAQRHDDDDDCNKASLRAIHRTPVHHHGGLPPLSTPPPTAGADLPPHGDAFSPPSRAPEEAPRFGFPLQPTVGFAAPPVASAGAPTAGEGYPFIGSNPTVPVPTGMTDTATVLPLPDTGDGTGKVVGRAALVRVQIAMIGFLAIFSVSFLSSS